VMYWRWLPMFRTEVIGAGKCKCFKRRVKASDQWKTNDFYPEAPVTTYKTTQSSQPRRPKS
jgi:hypothetical protein